MLFFGGPAYGAAVSTDGPTCVEAGKSGREKYPGRVDGREKKTFSLQYAGADGDAGAPLRSGYRFGLSGQGILGLVDLAHVLSFPAAAAGQKTARDAGLDHRFVFRAGHCAVKTVPSPADGVEDLLKVGDASYLLEKIVTGMLAGRSV